MLGQPVRTFDQLAASAIAELANMISGNALTELAASGFICDVSPPSIVRGTHVRITAGVERVLVIPLRVEDREVELCVGLREAQAVQSATIQGARKCQNY
jgi:chemotaxis protein CheX